MALLACAPQLPATRQPVGATFRTAGAPIYSTAALPVARMIGTWRQIAGFGATKPCTPTPFLRIAADAQGIVSAQYDLCMGPAHQHGAGVLASDGAPGRYRIAGLPAPLWVLWMDEGNRTAALGTPAGSFGMILSKDTIPADHLRAAREVLAWNGYDLTQFYQY